MLLAVTLMGSLTASLYNWMEVAFYPVLLSVFIIASLGIPIPEDLPLIVAGWILFEDRHVHAIASWPLTILVSAIGIMSGDNILYMLGRRWGMTVFQHRSVKWLITPARLAIMTDRFHRWGAWACFFGRFMVGVRAVMCLTAGVTRYAWWRFFLADLAGALLSIPFFIFLGYKFNENLPALKAALSSAQLILLPIAALGVFIFVKYEMSRARKKREAAVAARLAEAHNADARERRGGPEGGNGAKADSADATGPSRFVASKDAPMPARSKEPA
ncbi:MAG: DedA family protein [Phycisphaerales bacterium]|nr:DedA family protein [Phycisphaerales bacterium]